MFARAFVCGLVVSVFVAGFSPAVAEDSPLMKLLKSGRVPEERLPTVIEMLCRSAGPDDLRYVFDQVIDEKYPAAARKKGVQSLIDAAQVRKQIPSGDLSGLSKLMSAKDAELRRGALQLATLWKVESLASTFQKMLEDPKTTPTAKQAALEGLLAVGGEGGKKTIESLAAAGQPMALRFEAIAAVAEYDLPQAAVSAHQALLAATPQDDTAVLMDAFLQRRNGPEKLAEELAKKPPALDVAKRALRHMFASGHSDKVLADVLSAAAGLAADMPPPSQEEVQKIAQEVSEKGDAARGELVFRRGDVACMRCHAVAHAGGQVGPELSAVGSISPVDYIVNSILNPNLAIKEAYVTRVILTSDGQLFTGIVTERDDDRVLLKDALNHVHTISTEDIEAEKEGETLMPRGLTKFLTHQEFLDLAKFVSELGKPGQYAIRSVPTMQRWRVMAEPPASLVDDVPNAEQIRVDVLDAPEDAWAAAYGTVEGDLPLAELIAAYPTQKVLILKGEVDVIEPGAVQFDVQAPAGTSAWVGPENFSLPKFTTELAAGKHVLILRVPIASQTAQSVRVTITRADGSAAQFEVVGGS